jgi:hypothetical protein
LARVGVSKHWQREEVGPIVEFARCGTIQLLPCGRDVEDVHLFCRESDVFEAESQSSFGGIWCVGARFVDRWDVVEDQGGAGIGGWLRHRRSAMAVHLISAASPRVGYLGCLESQSLTDRQGNLIGAYGFIEGRAYIRFCFC